MDNNSFRIEIEKNLSSLDRDTESKIKFRIGLKHWTGTLIIAVIAGFVIFGLLRGQEFLASFLVGRETKKIQRELERPYREDKYGGKTPEETFDLFLEALRKGDIELASKYFELENQEEWVEKLSQYKENNSLSDFLKELERERKEWKFIKNDGEIAEYGYTVVVEKPTKTKFNDQIIDIPPGEYKNSIIFIKSFNKLWKISSL